MLKLHSILAVGVWALGLFALAAPASAQSCPALLNHTFPRLQDESPQPLCQYQGRVLLVVNTARYCGFTPQYEGLEKLHAKYAARGLTVLGFPSCGFRQPGKNKQQGDCGFLLQYLWRQVSDVREVFGGRCRRPILFLQRSPSHPASRPSGIFIST